MILLAVICLGAGILLPFYKEALFDGAGKVLLGEITQQIAQAIPGG
jgi:hypothetical protein